MRDGLEIHFLLDRLADPDRATTTWAQATQGDRGPQASFTLFHPSRAVLASSTSDWPTHCESATGRHENEIVFNPFRPTEK